MSFGETPTITFDPRNPNLSELGADALVIGEPGEGKAYFDSKKRTRGEGRG